MLAANTVTGWSSASLRNANRIGGSGVGELVLFEQHAASFHLEPLDLAFSVGAVEVDMEQNAALAQHVHCQTAATGASTNWHGGEAVYSPQQL